LNQRSIIMKPARFPRVLILLFAAAVLLTLVLGAIHPPAAALGMRGTLLPSTSLLTSPAAPTPTGTDTPDPILIQQSHVTDGITALGIIIVAVVVFGVLLGTRQQRHGQRRQ
jgi:hypothetical protein